MRNTAYYVLTGTKRDRVVHHYAPTYNPPGSYYSRELYANTFSKLTPKVTPSYRVIKKLGMRLKPLAYEIFKKTNSVNWGYEYTTNGRTLSSYTVGPIAVFSGSPTLIFDSEVYKQQAQKLAVTKFLLGIKDGKFSATQAYAESQQLQRLVGSTTVTLAAVFQHLRRGQLSAAGSRLGLIIGKRQHARYTRDYKRIKTDADIDRLLANGVLAVQYGIRPLISDVIGAAELYAQKQCAEVVNTFKSTVNLKVDDRRSGTYVNAYGYGTQMRSMIVSGTVRVTIGCTFEKGSEVVHTLKQLGFSNPLLLAWELLPWSFVIDWFIPFGNYLSSIDATLGLEFKDGYTSVRTSLACTTDQGASTRAGYGSFQAFGASQKLDIEQSFVRTVQTGFVSPRLPQFKNPLSWEHAVNGIALLTGFKKTAYRK